MAAAALAPAAAVETVAAVGGEKGTARLDGGEEVGGNGDVADAADADAGTAAALPGPVVVGGGTPPARATPSAVRIATGGVGGAAATVASGDNKR